MGRRHRLEFPRECDGLQQDEAYFYLIEGKERERLRFHDYDRLFAIPGLYEQIFYDRLKCCSPRKVCDMLKTTIQQSHCSLTELRALDLGAGNGMVGELLRSFGVSRVVGIDICQDAAQATERDRPGVYDDYVVADLTDLSEDTRSDLVQWSLDCLITVAALGFGDIPRAIASNQSPGL